MQEVSVELKTRHRLYDDWQEEVNRYAGRFVWKESDWYLTYKEQLEGAGEVSTIWKISEGVISLVRQGAIQTKQMFKRGKTDRTTYRSPHGTFLMELHVNKMKVTAESDIPSQVEISYQLWLNEQYAGDHELRLQIQSAGQSAPNL
ncbi:DUF1934 domain-containing protein [Brevibacillus composti]|uniref:DUF1934 domain-containing protein n=1 Tax=Brevibacillus composti TaxID=2796470 RepID=A0A7T5JNM1_9BACL|nr:DUF1934 domain-containing protein [Brevibacillus composti]QQE74266.1 DUF1934 domain-containing protein [Brevibacillus composti]QUO41348.1 DUF1934 domain-containing protein [Brevibacillus composti]